MLVARQQTTYRTAESVSPRHPDKLCDQISDAILDAYLAGDAQARVAVETMGGHGQIYVVGEVTANCHVDVASIVQRLAGEVRLQVNIVRQCPNIARAVNSGGAGDLGIMSGYACDETEQLLPLEVLLARDLNQLIYQQWPYDGKTQVTNRNGLIQTVVASFQHAPQSELTAVISQWLTQQRCQFNTTIHANPAGEWRRGGFEADTGLTGRKLVVDNYGPRVPIGGGSFSGKDPSKVDRSGAYMARRIAVDYLRAHGAHEVYCYLAYAMSLHQPLEATVIIDGHSQPVRGYNLTPPGIIEALDLRNSQYEPTARYGHFGHGFAWDK